jgi:hypothetical protein
VALGDAGRASCHSRAPDVCKNLDQRQKGWTKAVSKPRKQFAPKDAPVVAATLFAYLFERRSSPGPAASLA